MRAFLGVLVVAAMAVSLMAQVPPVVLPQSQATSGKALQPPATSRRTTSGTTIVSVQSGASGVGVLNRGGSVSQICPPDTGGKRQVIVVPQQRSWWYSDGALQDLAEAEWAKVRLMEEELRQKEEQARKEHELRMAEFDAKREEAFLKGRQGSWDRATAMYPDLLDPKSKLRVWYEHLLKRAREMTDRWGRPVRAPELDSPDYPEVLANRAAGEVGIKPLPLPPASVVAAAADAGGPGSVPPSTGVASGSALMPPPASAESEADVGDILPD